MTRKVIRASDILSKARSELASLMLLHGDVLSGFISSLDMNLPHLSTFELCPKLIELQCAVNIWKEVIQDVLDYPVSSERELVPFPDRLYLLREICYDRLNMITLTRSWEISSPIILIDLLKLTEVSTIASVYHKILQDYCSVLDQVKNGSLFIEDDITIVIPQIETL